MNHSRNNFGTIKETTSTYCEQYSIFLIDPFNKIVNLLNPFSINI
ncbi:MAG: hypothetical protein QW607_10080 [Desulfurococcaceae archaeon]